MEKYLTFLKPYRTTLQQLEQENQQIADRAEANRDNSIMRQLEIGKMERQLKQLKDFYDAVPEDVKRSIERDNRTARNQRPNRQER